MKPVCAYSLNGKFIVACLRSLLAMVYLFKGKQWQRPPANFHEDPAHYKIKDIIFFAYKYYFKPLEQFESNDIKGNLNFTFLKPNIEASDNRVTITAGGDLMPYEWVNSDYCKALWDDIGDDFFSGDIVIANLETPINRIKPAAVVPELMLNDMEFNGDAAMFDVFNGNSNYKGFDILSTANNHSFDQGETGILNTIEFLNEREIHYTGTSASETTVHDFPILERNGIKIAFIACTYSLNHLQLPPGKAYLCNHIKLNQANCDLSFIKKQVLLAHERGADIVVGSMHYGNAYQLFPGNHIIDITKRLFDECGLDILLGNHGHNLQPLIYHQFVCPITQRSKQGLAAFCLGDFVAYDIFTWGHLPIWLKIELAKTKNGVVLSDVTVNPIYVCGIYHSKLKRDLRLLNALRLWDAIAKSEDISLPNFNIEEAKYLKKIFSNVFEK